MVIVIVFGVLLMMFVMLIGYIIFMSCVGLMLCVVSWCLNFMCLVCELIILKYV